MNYLSNNSELKKAHQYCANNKEQLIEAYSNFLRTYDLNEYIFTEGSIWTDRIYYRPDLIQTTRTLFSVSAYERDRGTFIEQGDAILDLPLAHTDAMSDILDIYLLHHQID